MESEDELKEIDTKNRKWYYFDDLMRFGYRDVDFSHILFDEKLYKENTKIFQSMTFHTKFQRVQNHCVLGSIK